MKDLARIFPTKTSMSPDDPDVYFGPPDLFTPRYKEAHISVAFTWDIQKAFDLKRSWEKQAKVIRIGGPGMTDIPGEFTPGLYLKQGLMEDRQAQHNLTGGEHG